MGQHLIQQVSCSVVPGWPAQHICMSGVYLWYQDDLPKTFAWVVSICGTRMTYPRHLHEWCLSVMPGWPAQDICMSGVYLWCQDDLPKTVAWVVFLCGARMTCPRHLHEWCLSVEPGWPAQDICLSGVYSPIYSSSKWQWESFFYLCVKPLSSQPIFVMALRTGSDNCQVLLTKIRILADSARFYAKTFAEESITMDSFQEVLGVSTRGHVLAIL